MKRIALLTSIAMAVPVAAYAQPTVRADVQVVQRDRDPNWSRERYDHYGRSHWAKDFRGRWSPLAQDFNVRTERQFINLGGNGRFRKLRVEGVRGEPVILKIAIEFADKTTQVVEYRESLPSGTGEVIDLNGEVRKINRIIVYSDPHSRGSYSIYGA